VVNKHYVVAVTITNHSSSVVEGVTGKSVHASGSHTPPGSCLIKSVQPLSRAIPVQNCCGVIIWDGQHGGVIFLLLKRIWALT